MSVLAPRDEVELDVLAATGSADHAEICGIAFDVTEQHGGTFVCYQQPKLRKLWSLPVSLDYTDMSEADSLNGQLHWIARSPDIPGEFYASEEQRLFEDTDWIRQQLIECHYWRLAYRHPTAREWLAHGFELIEDGEVLWTTSSSA